MKRISSRWTFFYKRIFPLVWFGFVLVFVVIGLVAWAIGSPLPYFPFLIVSPVMAVVGYVLMKNLIFDLVDEVLDTGDALVVRNQHQEECILLANIMNVRVSSFTNPPRVTLLLRQPSINFGDKISCCLPARLLPFSSNPGIDEVIRRIDAKRRA
jgi:hypothetical protein